ncbi:MAG TPA: 5-dehydro-2-deoxygluconokinase [Candidatus Lambdaproteobacteria bacterium]|nr:5-dehydro-2-deoxygluconokinase [Candidatus Lambdaproteobacteria bacterium]HIB45249.1 5-dehydro-2-deoxygluconokinase [Candidatus Lambdaproteobacteria bacterium]HIB93941.1 5-dehydro-2-deoxygluconokinase [Candidatus Lambdaproteobacteria bacterium]
MTEETRHFCSNRNIDIICMGRVAVDLYAEQVHSPLEDAQSFRKYLGGCAGNTAVGTARLGLKSAMFSCVGSDDMGVYLRKTLENEGVDTSLLRNTPEHLTALVLLGVNPPERFPLIFYRENCADMQINPDDADPEIFKNAKALLITGTGLSTPEMRVATKQAVKVAKNSGCAVILDIDYRPVLWGLAEAGDGETRFVASEEVTREIQPFLSELDLIVGTEEEVQICAGKSGDDGEETLQSCLTSIRKGSSATVVLKRGADGCEVYSRDSDTPISARSFQIEVLNVLGAGDAFMSGFLRGWLRNESLKTCALYGNACGALVVTRHGCSPAAPSFAEIEYFIRDFDDVPDLVHHPKMEQLHLRTELGQPQKQELLILAYDHRTQFEDSCRENGLSLDSISRFKELVYEGFQKVYRTMEEYGCAVLIDPEYGETILKNSADTDYVIGVPIEKAGAFPLSWLKEDSLYQQLLERPPTWFVKVLWRFHPQMNPEDKDAQLTQLRKLNEVCNALKRKLMVELIIPEGFTETGKSLGETMAEVYETGIYPFWWKITALDTKKEWLTMTAILDQYDPDVGLIILGKNAPIEQFKTWFRVARSTPHTCGFAIGRSIFWEPWEQFAEGLKTDSEVSSMIAERYQQVIDIWQNL